jgi:hypothetical protein
VIHHQDEPVGVRNVVVDQVPDAVRPVDPGALVAHPNHAPALQWGGHEEAGDHPTADVFRVVADGTVRRLPLQRRLQSTLDDAAANAADGDRMDRDLAGNRGIGSGGADLALVSREQDGRAGQQPGGRGALPNQDVEVRPFLLAEANGMRGLAHAALPARDRFGAPRHTSADPCSQLTHERPLGRV